MVKVFDIYNYLNSIAQFDTQESWDNSGLLAGDKNEVVNKITVALDFTSETVEEAKQNGSNLIVTHHPAIFGGIKSVTSENPVYEAVKNNINVICSHTCLDMADGGVNDCLCELLGMENVEKIYSSDENCPIMRKGEIHFENAEKFAVFVSEKLGGSVRFSDCGKKVGKVGVCTGSGCSLMGDIIKSGCDTFLTGDASHHNFIDATVQGINLVAAGHFETENPVTYYLMEKLKENFSGLEVVKAHQSSPCKTVNYGS